MLQTQHLLCSHFPICLSPPQTHFLFPPSLSSSPLNFLYKPVSLCSVSAHSRSRPEQWLAEAPEPTTSIPTAPYTPLEFAPEGPDELPPSSSPVFATTDDPSSIQVATSVLLTGAISVFLFRSLRRRARRAKELVRQITITIRTIINGLCYLATFVFGINAVGLVLYAGQLAINSIMEDTSTETESQGKEQSTVESPPNSGVNSGKDDQSSDETQ
ncbi:hypothetical protein PRUPE_4G173400 [Prunus persica]|uniref:Uncharacterized protein n=1 Tax=Prunus persica TaxID=3760 RepID=A0A251PLY4_PRUPE|nr:hypothetical protein PRUPE_4G173400 [Prunus persica]